MRNRGVLFFAAVLATITLLAGGCNSPTSPDPPPPNPARSLTIHQPQNQSHVCPGKNDKVEVEIWGDWSNFVKDGYQKAVLYGGIWGCGGLNHDFEVEFTIPDWDNHDPNSTSRLLHFQFPFPPEVRRDPNFDCDFNGLSGGASFRVAESRAAVNSPASHPKAVVKTIHLRMTGTALCR